MEKCKTAVYLSDEVQRELRDRLNRITGQVKGLLQMIEKHSECESILIQFASVKSALSSAMVRLLEGHIETCVLEDVRQRRGEEALKKLGSALSIALRRT